MSIRTTSDEGITMNTNTQETLRTLEAPEAQHCGCGCGCSCSVPIGTEPTLQAQSLVTDDQATQVQVQSSSPKVRE